MFSNHRYRHGFTLIDVLFSLSISILIIFSSLSIFQLISYKDNYASNQLYLSIIQLREELLGVSDIIVNNDSLSYFKEDTMFQIEKVNGHLIKKPGTDILIRNIENASFYIYDQSIYLSLKINHHYYEFVISFVREQRDEEKI